MLILLHDCTSGRRYLVQYQFFPYFIKCLCKNLAFCIPFFEIGTLHLYLQNSP